MLSLDVISALLVCSMIGTSIGTMTGLIPGLHVNTLAILLISASTSISSFISGFTPLEPTISLAIIIACAGIAHTYLDFIPSAFLGIPDDDTALTVLPAHMMVMQGRGYEAVCLSAIGSGYALIASVALLVPYRYFLLDLGIYGILRSGLLPLILSLSFLLIATESGGPWPGMRSYGILSALLLFLISGLYGVVALGIPPDSPISLPGSMLMPCLSGLFGIPPMMQSLMAGSSPPDQTLSVDDIHLKGRLASISIGTLSGSILGFLPGLTSSHATVLSMIVRGESDRREVIVTLSSVNTANAFFSIMALFVIGRGRSGVANSIGRVAGEMSQDVLIPCLIIGLIFGGAISFILTILAGRCFSRWFTKIPYRSISAGMCAFVVLLTYLYTGMVGLLILAVGSIIGHIPLMLNVRRSHAMGVLLVPVILFFS